MWTLPCIQHAFSLAARLPLETEHHYNTFHSLYFQINNHYRPTGTFISICRTSYNRMLTPDPCRLCSHERGGVLQNHIEGLKPVSVANCSINKKHFYLPSHQTAGQSIIGLIQQPAALHSSSDRASHRCERTDNLPPLAAEQLQAC